MPVLLLIHEFWQGLPLLVLLAGRLVLKPPHRCPRPHRPWRPILRVVHLRRLICLTLLLLQRRPCRRRRLVARPLLPEKEEWGRPPLLNRADRCHRRRLRGECCGRTVVRCQAMVVVVVCPLLHLRGKEVRLPRRVDLQVRYHNHRTIYVMSIVHGCR